MTTKRSTRKTKMVTKRRRSDQAVAHPREARIRRKKIEAALLPVVVVESGKRAGLDDENAAVNRDPERNTVEAAVVNVAAATVERKVVNGAPAGKRVVKGALAAREVIKETLAGREVVKGAPAGREVIKGAAAAAGRNAAVAAGPCSPSRTRPVAFSSSLSRFEG